jgi:hypothetical protein
MAMSIIVYPKCIYHGWHVLGHILSTDLIFQDSMAITHGPAGSGRAIWAQTSEELFLVLRLPRRPKVPWEVKKWQRNGLCLVKCW